MKKYKHLFFDLDHTLWDYERNASETLAELYSEYSLEGLLKVDEREFIATYHSVNDELWDKHHVGLIDKNQIRENRFPAIFYKFGYNNQETAHRVSEEFLSECPKKGHIFPFVKEVLTYLKEKYSLHIITNGFKDIQGVKLKTSGLDLFFKEIIISEEVGYKKPQQEIFDHALKKARAKRNESIMIGDNLKVDIAGARSSAIDQVYFNPKNLPFFEEVTYQINSHQELKTIL